MYYQNRYDYVLIWGHGLQYKKQILDIIRSHNGFEIIKVLYHYPKRISKLVKEVYSYDYAPFHHLKSKTRYLKKTQKQVLFVFVNNKYPDEDYFGEGSFRHIESRSFKHLKEQIRNQFNDRIGDIISENHVIHASDNEQQTHFILKYLGFDGLSYLKKKSKILSLPYYLNRYKSFIIKDVYIENLVCNTAIGNRKHYTIKTINLKDSPQYRALSEGTKIYQQYIYRFLGGPLTDDYSVEKYIEIAETFEYLAPPYCSHYIAIQQLDDNMFLIVDGVHRAAILQYRGIKSIPVAILN